MEEWGLEAGVGRISWRTACDPVRQRPLLRGKGRQSPVRSGQRRLFFCGETFGINVSIAENKISRITYQRDPTKADVEFKFTQEKSPNGLMMLLVIRNKLKRSLFLDAKMTVPEKKEIYKTSVLPVKASLSNVESWPHPIVQLVLGKSADAPVVVMVNVAMAGPLLLGIRRNPGFWGGTSPASARGYV